MRSRRNGSFPVLGESDFFPFPPPDSADGNGIVCSGGNLSPGMLLSAYRQGIFPWFSEGDPILWFSPDPRCVLYPGNLHVSKTLRKVMRRGAFTVTADRAFGMVIDGCASAYRPGQGGTWITSDMNEAYRTLHALGWAHSCEAWEGDVLAGGLYGVSIGSVFFGESMFHDADNASRVAFASLAEALFAAGITLIDCQVMTENMRFMGAVDVPRADYLRELAARIGAPPLKGDWSPLFPAGKTDIRPKAGKE